MLWLRKGVGFAGAWTPREQNQLLAACFGLPELTKSNNEVDLGYAADLCQGSRQAYK